MNQNIVRLRRPPVAERKPFFTRRRVALGIALLLILLVAVVAYSLAPDRQLAKVKQLRTELTGQAARKQSPEQRREQWQQYRREVEKLSPEQREALGREQEQRYYAELNEFFKKSRKEQTAELDRQIDRMEAFRRQAQQRGGARPGQPPGGGQPGVFAGPGSPGGQRPRDADERERRRKARLDQTTPEQRAQRDLYRKMMEQRRRERGLPSSPFGRR